MLEPNLLRRLFPPIGLLSFLELFITASSEYIDALSSKAFFFFTPLNIRGSLLEVDEDVDDADDVGEEESDDCTGDGEFDEKDFLDEDEEP